jgi:hypothetical protein
VPGNGHAESMNRAPTPLVVLASAAAALSACSVPAPLASQTPADATFSVGVTLGQGMVPQGSGPVKLRFLGNVSGPDSVLARRVATPPTIDGSAADWTEAPVSVVPLQAPATLAGVSPSGWYCRWRTHHAVTLDPATGLPQCPTQCDPANPPATRAEGSTGCSVPLPPHDLGVSQVRISAAFDDQRLYLLLQWEDAGRDDQPRPWTWDDAAKTWKVDGSHDEDAAYLTFGIGNSSPAHDARGCAAACHLAQAPTRLLPPAPLPTPWPPTAYAAWFTDHTDAVGERLDAWAWRAGTTAPYQVADDLHVEQAGIQGDRCYRFDGYQCAASCTTFDGLGSPVFPCGRGPAASNSNGSAPAWRAAGDPGFSLDPPYLFTVEPGQPSGWNPAYGAQAIAAGNQLPTRQGALLPSTVRQRPSPRRDDVTAVATWSGGTWTLELSRALVTGDLDDAQFPLRPGGQTPAGGGSATYSTLSATIFVPRCATSACHSGGPPTNSGIPLSLDPAVGWSQLVSAPSIQAPLNLVQPYQPGQSYLVNKLRGTQQSVGGLGDRMPPITAGAALSEDEILNVEAWIAKGAPND